MITPILRRMTPARPHLAVLVGMLASSFLLTGILFFQAYDATRGQQQQAQEALRDAASRAAGEWNENLHGFLTNGATYSLRRLTQSGASELLALGPEGIAGRIDLGPLCPCPPSEAQRFYRGSFVYDLVGDSLRTADIPLSPRGSELLRQWVSQGAGQSVNNTWRVGIIAALGSFPEGAIVYGIRHESANTPELVIGYHMASSPLESYFRTLWDKAEFIQLRNLPGDSVFAIRVADRDGGVWFRSQADLPQMYVATDTMLPVVPGLSATFALLPGAESKVIIGGMPRSRLPTLLALIAVTTGLLVMSMLLIRRESEITRLRADFVAGVSHELRTPLAQIRMFTETLILGRVRTESERQRSLEIIDQEARRLTHLVENVLMFARSERGSSRVNLEPTDVAADVRDAIHGFAILSRSRAVEIKPELQEDIVLAVDRGALRQILLNLLDNAVKYGPLGQRVTVGLALFGGGVRLWVDDEGPGVPPEERARVFESFYRLERHAASPVAGSGIGLAIVRELVQLHEGRVWLDEAPGGGARVVVEFPGAYLRAEAKTGEWAVA